jgi:hypothetical protein
MAVAPEKAGAFLAQLSRSTFPIGPEGLPIPTLPPWVFEA